MERRYLLAQRHVAGRAVHEQPWRIGEQLVLDFAIDRRALRRVDRGGALVDELIDVFVDERTEVPGLSGAARMKQRLHDAVRVAGRRPPAQCVEAEIALADTLHIAGPVAHQYDLDVEPDDPQI